MTITSRKKIIARIAAFERWFVKTVPNKAVRMNTWRGVRKGGRIDHIPAELQRQPVTDQIACGVVGCLGGWLAVSPMYRKYEAENPKGRYVTFMAAPDSLPFAAEREHLFSARCRRISEKTEALDRINTVLRYHRKKLKELQARA